MATELGPSGVRVNVVSPGFIDTPIFENNQVPQEVKEELFHTATDQTSLARVGRADEIADAVVFLATSQSSYIIGSELLVDGGYTIAT